MHIADFSRGILGANGVVGGGFPIIVGAGLSIKLRNTSQVGVVFFGDGAANRGTFHEACNMAAIWKLHIVFVCENNLYAMGTALKLSESVTDIAQKAAAYGIKSEAVDGMDVLATQSAAEKAAAYVRSGKGPYFLECRTYRFRAHSMFDPELYRTKEEVQTWKKRDPILTFGRRLKDWGIISDKDMDELNKKIDAEIKDAVAFAEAGACEPVEDLMRFVYSQQGEI